MKQLMKRYLVLAVIMISSLFLSGCYVLSQSGTFLSDRIRAEDLQKVLEAPDTPDQTKAFLSEALQITSYAVEQIGLKESKNYTTYLQLERDHLAYIVYAAPRFSFEQHMWTFPITGAIPYKGYYRLSAARKEEQKMISREYDTFVSVVDGFSSLGFFKDPLYSFMIEYTPYHLASLIIHELTHSTIWVKHAVTFNEQLASFIGELGGQEYVRSQYGQESEAYRMIFDRKHDQQQFTDDLFTLRNELQDLYDDPSVEHELRLMRKQQLISAWKERFSQEYEQHYRTDSFRHIPEIDINNAFIAIHAVYYERSELFDEIYAYVDQDLQAMIELLKRFDGTRGDPVPSIRELIR
jgi:predicted aminopeptidase